MPDKHEPEREPQSLAENLFAQFLTAREQGQSPDFEALLRQHPELATRLRQLDAQYVHWKSIFAQLAAPPATTSVPLAARLESRYGDDVDPGISLDPEPADADSGPSSELLKRLHAHAPKHARYKLQGEIGRGGMGAVIRVWDADLRRTLAMKVVLGKEDRTAKGATPPIDSKTLGRFLEEAQITGQLDHPGIVPVHELGLGADGQVYFTMRLVKGEDLRTIFRHVETGHEGWNTARALSVMLKVCEAMAYAHSKGVIHRDLKPANIMVGKYGEVYVMDWGLARVAGKQDLHDLRMQEPQAGPSSQSVHTERREERDGTPDSPLITLDGTVMGTPAYMSPEQARGELAELGPHSDVYAVGAMLYHLLLVKHIEMPYVPKQARLSQYRVLMLAQEGAPTAIAKLERSAPGPLIAIAEKAMARRIPDRYRNMEELASDLRAYTEGRVVKAYETGSWAETRHWVKRNKALAATIAAGITVLAVGLFTALRLQDETEFARARLAERNEELSSKNSVLRAQAHEQQFRAMIQDLARFRAQCRTQEGLTRKGQPAYQWWLEEANRLLEGAPGDQSDTTEWRPGWKDVQAKLTELRPGALPWSAEDRANDIATHPVQIRIHRLETERDEQCVDVAEELSAPALAVRERLMSQIIYSEFCLGERDGPGEFEVAQANAKQLGSKNVSELNKSAWKFVNPDVNRASPEELVLALLLARRALELAPPDASPAVRDTYAWSLLWLGRTSDALAAADEAIAVAGANRSRYEASKMRMQEQIARWSDSELPARRAELEVWRRDLAAWQLPAEIELQIAQAKASIAEQFESRIAVLRKQAEEQRTWRFADSQTEWWHGQIQQLEADLASLDQMHKAAMASVSTEQAKTRWAHAIESIARSPRYAGQLWPSGRNLTPQIGLLPIGENPSSGLWEFIHLQSGIEPRSGTNGDALRGEAGQLSMAPETGIVFVLLPGGHVPRESSPQGQAEWITGIPLEPFFVSKYETTHEQWDRISLRKEFSRKIKVPLVPANRISWDDAGAMCLRELGWCELPTEVQWEYACRGGTTTRWWCGDDESNLETAASIAWTPSNGTPNTRALRPVGELAPNPFGLHDVHGNVLEWCADSSPVLSDPRPGDGRRDNGSDNSVAREFRGGSWKLGPESSASSYRNSEPPGARFDDIGVRLIRRVTP